MALRQIKTISILASTVVGSGSAGGTSLSDPIDLQDIATVGGAFALHYKVAAGGGGSGTCGTTGFTYLLSATRNGSYVKPKGAGTIGTSLVTDGDEDIVSFTPVLAPFMKIQAIVGTSNPAVVTADLYVR